MALVNGEDDARRVFDFLLEHDQDVQLHIHPTYRFYAEFLEAHAQGRSYAPPPANDLLGGFEETRQMQLLTEAVGLFHRFAGRAPVAFRAGCFAANRMTLRCLRAVGVTVDSSFNPCYPQWSFPDEGLRPNAVTTVEGVWEVPVSVARTPIPEGQTGLKHADPCALSFRELRGMLEHGAGTGQEHFVIIFHSFSAVKPSDPTYSRMRPDRLTIHRLHRLLEYLTSRPDLYKVTTFGALVREGSLRAAEAPPVAKLPMMTAGVRKSLQAINRVYWV
jgi:hypothetical protein